MLGSTGDFYAWQTRADACVRDLFASCVFFFSHTLLYVLGLWSVTFIAVIGVKMPVSICGFALESVSLWL